MAVTAKVCFIGDDNVGKRTFISRIRDANAAVPAGANYSVATVDLDGRVIELHMHQPQLQHPDDAALRQACTHPRADVYVICYNAADLATLDRAINRWMPLTQGFHANTPWLLVGLQADLNFDGNAIAERLHRFPIMDGNHDFTAAPGAMFLTSREPIDTEGVTDMRDILLTIARADVRMGGIGGGDEPRRGGCALM